MEFESGLDHQRLEPTIGHMPLVGASVVPKYPRDSYSIQGSEKGFALVAEQGVYELDHGQTLSAEETVE